MLTFKNWLDNINEVDGMQTQAAPVADITPQQKQSLADMLGKEMAKTLPKLRPGQKIKPADIAASTLKSAFKDPKLQSLNPQQVQTGVSKIMSAIPGVRV